MNAYLPARLLQLLGVVLLVAAAVFWAVTGHESALFVGAAMTLIGLGAYQGLRVTIRVSDREPPGSDD